jgi:hypothetical protein
MTTPETEAAGPARFVTVNLTAPIRRGETEIATLNVRRPQAGELRGLALGDILNTDITALLTLLPRVTEPPLTSAEVNALDPEDFAELGGAVRGFFMTAGERAMVETMMAQHQPVKT